MGERSQMEGKRSERFNRLLRQAVIIGQRRIPPGLRTVTGLLFVLGGTFGFLPILGFWMIPVGLFLIALDFPPLRRRVMEWLRHRRQRNNKQQSAKE